MYTLGGHLLTIPCEHYFWCLNNYSSLNAILDFTVAAVLLIQESVIEAHGHLFALANLVTHQLKRRQKSHGQSWIYQFHDIGFHKDLEVTGDIEALPMLGHFATPGNYQKVCGKVWASLRSVTG